jgi:uncharacterized protein YggE
MLRRISAPLFLITASFAFGQLDSNSVTVTASRTTTLQPDQALFAVTITTDPAASLSDVLAAVQPAGLTFSNFSSVSTTTAYTYTNGQQQAQQQTQWSFQLLAPLANTRSAVSTLTALQKSVTQANPAWGASFSLQGSQVSQRAQQTQTCDLAGVIGDARTQAQNLATAAGRTLSGILALSTNTNSTIGTPVSLYAVSGSPSCLVTVKFALLGSN